MSDVLLFTIMVDKRTGDISQTSNMRGMADMLTLLNTMEQICAGMRNAVHDVFSQAAAASPPPADEPQADS